MPKLVCALVTVALAGLLTACGSSSTTTVTVRAGSTTTSSTSTRTDTTASGSSSATGLQSAYVNVIDSVSPEVVQVSNQQGLGSGIVFDAKGDIVTNAHVVAGGGPYTVTDSRGRSHHATVVGQFAEDDLAVVHAPGITSHAASFANSSSVRVGDIVLAIGNPLGLSSSVTNGIVSALGREVGEPNGVVIPDAIQTSAPINPGNSGGALVDLQGQVVGIPTLAATDPELGGTAPGIGFAIPSSVVTDIAGQIVQHGHVINSHRAYLGVDLATGLSSGAVIAQVRSGGPAAKAGLRSGDIITSIAGQSIASPPDVASALATLKPGQAVKVGIVTASGQGKTVSVTLGQYPGTSSG